MYQVSIKNIFLLSLIFFSFISLAEEAFQAGKHYQVLAEPIATRDPKKIEVIEFFWFGCGHCYSLENQLNAWEKNITEDVDFWRSPITWNEMAKTHAKLFFAAELLDKPEIITSTFIAIHANQSMMTSPREIKPFFASFGISADEYEKLFNSFGMKNKIRRAETFGLKYDVRGVPAFVVNGKYKVSASRNLGTNKLLDVVDYLIKLEEKKL
tara:strand:+ start:239 stop:871 length:633 start_codon:yes stop_codon:yes gene_type:complete